MDQILIVDDERQYREEAARVVERIGLEPVKLQTTAAALAYLRSQRPPRLVLMDLFLPGADAVTFRQEQVGDQAISGVPMALMVSTASLQRFSTSVGLPILTKPVSEADLRRLLASEAQSRASGGR